MSAEIQVNVENKGNLERQVNITVPAATVDEMFRERHEYLAKTAKIKGFREGHVPLNVIKQRFGEQVAQEITQYLVQRTLPQALEKEKIQAAGQPHIHDLPEPAEGKDYQYHAHVEIFPEIEPKGYEKIKITRYTAKPTDEDIESTLKRIEDSNKSFSDKDGEAEEGDMVIMDAMGYLKGEEEPFEGGDIKDHSIVIGSGALIPGFEDELKGMKAGEEKSFEIKFPEDYHAKAMAGKDARFDVHVKNVQSPEVKPADDELAKKFGAENLEDLKGKIREQFETDLAKAGEQRMKRELFDKLDEVNKFDVPPKLVESEFQAIWRNQMEELQRQGLPMEALGKSEDELRAEYRDVAARRVRLGLLITEIGRKENVMVTDEDINAEIDRVAATMPGQEDQVKAYYSQSDKRQQLMGPLFEKKVTDWLVSQGDVSDEELKSEDLLKEFG